MEHKYGYTLDKTISDDIIRKKLDITMKSFCKLISPFLFLSIFLFSKQIAAQNKENNFRQESTTTSAKEEDNPELAEYFWNKYNNGISDGKIKIKKYKRHERKYPYSLEGGLKNGDIIYTTNIKGPVVGHDIKSDEFFIIFHPDNIHRYPFLLKKLGRYLIIGTKGDGIIIVNTENFYLKKYDISSNGGAVENIEIEGKKIIINNSDIIDEPAF
ncbi:MAG: hypothetical protein AB1498_05245 [bacterium]